MHGTATPHVGHDHGPTADLVASLSRKYLTEINPERRDAIGEQIAAIIAGRVVALRNE